MPHIRGSRTARRAFTTAVSIDRKSIAAGSKQRVQAMWSSSTLSPLGRYSSDVSGGLVAAPGIPTSMETAPLCKLSYGHFEELLLVISVANFGAPVQLDGPQGLY